MHSVEAANRTPAVGVRDKCLIYEIHLVPLKSRMIIRLGNTSIKAQSSKYIEIHMTLDESPGN